MERKSGFGKFVGGLLVGATVGLLFAPKKGSETRKELKEKANDLIEQAKQVDINDVEKAINKKVVEIKNELADLDKEKVMSLAKEQADHIKSKCDDLVEYAINYGTPVLEKTAEAARVKAVEILKVTLDKLEKTENTKKKNK